MKLLTMQQTADYLELAEIEQTLNKGHALIHIGKTLAGVDFCAGEQHELRGDVNRRNVKGNRVRLSGFTLSSLE